MLPTDATPVDSYGPRVLKGNVHLATEMNMAIVVSRFNDLVTKELLRGSLECFQRHGGAMERTTVIYVPGAYELPVAIKNLLEKQKDNLHAVVALGCVLQGDTAHFDYVCSGMNAGLSSLALEYQVPVAMGVLTAETLDQALLRSGSKSGNKGEEATLAAIETASVIAQIQNLEPNPIRS